MPPYRQRHDTQYEPITWSSGIDCNMAAAADGARYFSLGLIDHHHDYYRGLAKNPDGSQDRNGTNITQAHAVLSHVGVPSTIYASADGHHWDYVESHISAGRNVIAHGDAGSIPKYLRGQIDKNFTGLHSVIFNRIAMIQEDKSVLVGDGLAGSWTWWPTDVAKGYMEAFPGDGLTFLTIQPRRLCAKINRANVRAKPTTASAILGTIKPTSRIHEGGVVHGGSVHGNHNWYRVFYQGQIAFVHTSVGKIV
jgi:hypothetical protein